MEKIYEIKIVSIESMPEYIRAEVVEAVKSKPQAFKEKFQGFAKVIYVTNSPKSIKSIEPITGNIIDFYDKISKSSGIVIPQF